MITVNGYAFDSEDVIALLAKVLWKHTVSLSTTGGCREAAEAAAGWLESVGPDYHPGGIRNDH